MLPGGMLASAVRMTPPSTPLSVRTSVVIAKATIKRLAATPSRFQPIHFLKPRESTVSSPCIHPPGGGGKGRKGTQSHKFEPSIKGNLPPLRQKAPLVQSLTRAGLACALHGRHAPREDKSELTMYRG